MASYVIHGFFVVACALHQQVIGLSFPGIVPTPPTLPQAFSISFSEMLMLSGEVLAKNNGTWYYDYANRRARFEHGQGQKNNFCAGQGLSPKDPQGFATSILKSSRCSDLCFDGPQACALMLKNKEAEWRYFIGGLFYDEVEEDKGRR
ncbi:hypothetical protein PoB_002398100 [Plakobranchus ocellatus]|uniref:Uncharacterized protein n=1 Tax=Plakobranchus ocellatus TaxID=259542 RepID=A0AAV3ZE11_9GAST|nr:hypothetical protein PoB_002398100 [Plakobranchus ocellatus]